MLFSNENQIKIVVFSLFLGLIFGFLYDIISIVEILSGAVSFTRGKLQLNNGFPARFLLFVCDGIFCLSVGLSFPIFTYAVNNGDLRWFIPAGCALGFALYHVTIGRLVLLSMGTVANAIRAAIYFTILKPAGYIIKIIRKFAVFVFDNTVCRIILLIHKKILSAKTEKIRKKIKEDIRFSGI